MSSVRHGTFVHKLVAAAKAVLANLKRDYLEHIVPDVVCGTIGFPPHKGLLAYLDYLEDAQAGAGVEQDRRFASRSPE
jgi:hypothetical protein